MAEVISSLQNARVKSLVRLRDRRERERTGTFLVEGYRELLRGVESGLTVEAVYVCPALFLGGNETTLAEAARASGAELVELSVDAFAKVSYRDRPEGILAVARRPETALARLRLDHGTFLLAVESIEKPGNLGTMLRTADAAGMTGVVVADPTTDPFNPNVVRASLGTLFTVPIAVSATDETIAALRAAGVRMVATSPSAPTLIWEADLTGPVAIVVGSEQYGLSETWFDAADAAVSIPMGGKVDSLNAAVAAAVAIFEAVRQRTVGAAER